MVESALIQADMKLTSKRFADTVVLAPEGRIDHVTAEAFKTALVPHLALCAAGRDRLVLDLAGVEYISSVGLRVLLLASKQAKGQGGALAVAALQPVVREIFEISKFTLVMNVEPTVREALAKLSASALAAFDAG
jgi:anti-anti-sigma factor